MDVFQTLAAELEPEARYHLLGAMANQLRYPNSQVGQFMAMRARRRGCDPNTRACA